MDTKWTPRKNGSISNKCKLKFIKDAPVAQLDRAADFESEGRRFDSYRAYHLLTSIKDEVSSTKNIMSFILGTGTKSDSLDKTLT